MSTLTLYINGAAVCRWPLAMPLDKNQVDRIVRQEVKDRKLAGLNHHFAIEGVISNFPAVVEPKKYVRDGVPWLQRQKGRNREAIMKGHKIAL